MQVGLQRTTRSEYSLQDILRKHDSRRGLRGICLLIALVQDVLDSMMMNIGLDMMCTLRARNLQVCSDFSSSQLAAGAHALLH